MRNPWSYIFARTKTLSDHREGLSDLTHNYLLCGRERATLSGLTNNIECSPGLESGLLSECGVNKALSDLP